MARKCRVHADLPSIRDHPPQSSEMGIDPLPPPPLGLAVNLQSLCLRRSPPRRRRRRRRLLRGRMRYRAGLSRRQSRASVRWRKNRTAMVQRRMLLPLLPLLKRLARRCSSHLFLACDEQPCPLSQVKTSKICNTRQRSHCDETRNKKYLIKRLEHEGQKTRQMVRWMCKCCHLEEG
jgi:hypothetical protein